MIPVRIMVFAPAAAGTGSSSDGLGAASASVIFVPDSFVLAQRFCEAGAREKFGGIRVVLRRGFPQPLAPARSQTRLD
jgi:hypothetical protein